MEPGGFQDRGLNEVPPLRDETMPPGYGNHRNRIPEECQTHAIQPCCPSQNPTTRSRRGVMVMMVMMMAVTSALRLRCRDKKPEGRYGQCRDDQFFHGGNLFLVSWFPFKNGC
jgi:hypothetical protein